MSAALQSWIRLIGRQLAVCARGLVGFAASCWLLVTVSIAATMTYEYDALGRLKKVTRSDGVTVTYTLDAAGNRTQVVTDVPDVTPPSVPTGLVASPVAWNRVDVSWNASTDNVGGTGVAGYRLYRDGTLLVTTSATSYADTGVLGSTSYSYRVAAYDGASPANMSAQSAPVSATTPADTIAPTTPTGLVASAPAYNQVNLSWSASSDSGGSGLAGYKIYRNGSYLTSVSGTSHADTTVAAATTYSYSVAAYDGAGNTSTQSTAANVTTPSAIPAPPASISGPTQSNNGNYSISWSSSAGATRYELWQNNFGGPFSKVYDGPNTFKSFSGKPAGEYTYKAKACNAAGCSSYSNEHWILVCNPQCL